MTPSLLTPPTSEPLTLDEAKDHLRLDPDAHDEDAYLDALIETARHDVEAHTDRALVTQTWTLKLDDFPRWDQIELPRAPLQSVTSIQYVGIDGTLTTLDASAYTVNAPAGPRARPGVISLAYDSEWPVPRAQRDAVTITFVAGYGAAADVPRPIKQAMLLLIGEMYERREDAIVGTIIGEVSLSASRLLASYIVGGFD